MADSTLTTDFVPVKEPPPVTTDFKPVKVPMSVEPSPYPFDPWMNEVLKDQSPEQQIEKRNGITNTIYQMAKPWLDASYLAGSSINRTLAHSTDTLDVMSRWFEAQGLGKREGFFEQMTKTYLQNADWWKARAEKVGINFLTELTGEAFALPSNALIGMTDFVLKVASGFSIPAIVGYQEAKEHDTDPFIGGLIEAAKTKTLDSMFKLMAPFSRYIQSLVMGTTFGVQAGVEAPAGERTKAFIKGGATGIGMAMVAPSGKWGIRDLYPEIGRSVPEIRKDIEAFEKVQLKEPAPVEEAKPTEPVLSPTVKDQFALPGIKQDLEMKGAKEGVTPTLEGTPLAEVARKAEVAKVQPELPIQPKMDEELIGTIRELRGYVKQGEAGKRIPVEDMFETNVWTGWGSSYPPFMRNKGWGKDEVLNAIDKGLSGQKLGKRQIEIFDAAKEEATVLISDRESLGAAAQGFLFKLPDDISQLKTTLERVPKWTGLKQRQEIAESISKTYTGVLGRAQTGFEKIKSTGTALWDWYTRPPQWTTFDDMLGQYLGGRQISGSKTSEFAKQIKDSIPELQQQAITNWVQAGGDRAILTERMNQTTDPKLKQGYEEALNLGNEHTTFAQNIHQYFNSKLDQAIEAGILDHGIENYVNQIWEKDNLVGLKLKAEINAGMLRQNPSFAKKRIFESYFDGEQAGFTPKDKRIGYLISAYEQSFNEAIAARGFIKELQNGDASDGRPLVVVRGSGSALPKGETPPEAYLVRPRSIPEEAFDYKEIAHPALRKWKWTTKDENGNPIFVEGDLIVHPEIYDHLHNVLSRSAVRESALGNIALKGNQELKSTLLSLSMFHQVQIGAHAVFHWENPFTTQKLDFEQPIQRDLVEHGLMVYNRTALSEFAEGLGAPGLINKIPVVGSYAQKYTEYLFTDLIPRLKMKLAIDMVDRNTNRYPDLSRDQVLKLSSDQANAAFAELNYKQMGRSQTTQDMFRLGALAPDFLEARARFVGEALKPYGREQAIALIRGTTLMYLAAKAIEGINTLIDDKAEIHWDRPFSVTIGDKEYTLRSIPGDIYHLVRDPRSFIYHRLNPSIIRPLIEAVTGRDLFGKMRDIGEQIKDYVTGFVPIPGQGLFTKQDRTIFDSILQSMGVSSFKHRSDAEQTVLDIQKEKARTGELPTETQDRIDLRNKLSKDYEKTKDLTPIKEAVKEGNITITDFQTILGKSLKTPVELGITHFSVPEGIRVWNKSTDEEKTLIQQPLVKKWMGWKATIEERKPYQQKMQEIIGWRNPKQGGSR